jgi:hypothetical protein
MASQPQRVGDALTTDLQLCPGRRRLGLHCLARLHRVAPAQVDRCAGLGRFRLVAIRSVFSLDRHACVCNFFCDCEPCLRPALLDYLAYVNVGEQLAIELESTLTGSLLKCND